MATDNNNKVLNVPNLRFPGFGGEWEREKLRDKCSFYSGGTPSSSNKSYYIGEIPFIRSGEISGDSTELFLSEFGLNNSSAKMVDIGDLLLALYGATSGQIAISKIRGAINQAILCIKSSYDNIFLKSVWEKHVDKTLQAYLQGGQGNLSADIVKNLSFYFPSLDEQNKISKLIVLIDERIETQNKIIEDLKKLKVAIRDKQLNTIRKHYGLNYQICDLLDYEQPTKYVVTDTEYSEDRSKTPVLTANKAFILGYTDESFGVYDKGACIILDDFTLDCKYVDFPFKVKSSAIKILTVKNGCSLRYVYEYLNYMNLETTEHKRHYISEIEPMIIAYPTDKKGIDDFNNIMSSFESKIEIENKYLQSLLTQKVYLLSNMFI